jgi:PAS domain S-box-containing protein
MSFRLKTILGIGLIEAVLLVLMVLSAQGFLRDSNQEQFVQRALSTVKLFSDATKNAVIATDLALLDSFVEEIKNNPEVVYVRVVGQGDMVLSQAGSESALQKKFKRDDSFADIDDSVFDISAPITESGFVFGRVEIGFSDNKIAQLLESSKRTLSGIAVVEILLVALFSYLLGTYLTHQLQYLKNGSEALASGKLGYQIPVRGTDELARTVGAFNRMSRKLKESELRKDAYLHSALHAIITLDKNGIVTELNGAAEILLLSAREEMIGQPVHRVLSLADGDQRLSLVAEKISDTDKKALLSKTHESVLNRWDGELVHLQWVISEVLLHDETIYVLFAENINDRKEAERSLIASTRAAQEANDAKSEFLANMTHELRTPLQGMIGFSSLGVKRAEKASPEKVKKYFETIQDSANTLLSLVNNLLDLTKLESGKMDYRFASANIDDTVKHVINELQAQAQSNSIMIEAPAVSICQPLVFDPDRLEQVLRNLLGNALKFSPAGSTINVTLEDTSDAVKVSIIDCGPGIPHGEIEKIFDKFSQSSVTRDGSGGTGLGLPICREIVSAHSGEIVAENKTDGGAVFTFTIPRNLPQSDDCEPGLLNKGSKKMAA